MPTSSDLRRLASQVLRCKADDPRVHGAILDRIREARERSESAGRSAIGECLEAALLLTRYVPHLEGGRSGRILAIAARLVEIAAEVCESEPSPAGDTGLESAGEDEVELLEGVLLGEILIRKGSIDVSAVERALALQRRSGVRFGEALVQLGATSREEVERALALQRKAERSSGAPANQVLKPAPAARPIPAELAAVSDVLLGEVMVRNGLVAPEALERGLGVQRVTGLRIGEALVSIGAASWDQVQEGLRLQRRARLAAAKR